MLLVMSLPLLGGAAELAPPTVGVAIPRVNVLANVTKMLGEAAARQKAAPSATVGGRWPAEGVGTTPPENTKGTGQGVHRAGTEASNKVRPKQAARMVAAEKKAGSKQAVSPVRVPNTVITIRSLSDIRRLADELDSAKQSTAAE